MLHNFMSNPKSSKRIWYENKNSSPEKKNESKLFAWLKLSLLPLHATTWQTSDQESLSPSLSLHSPRSCLLIRGKFLIFAYLFHYIFLPFVSFEGLSKWLSYKALPEKLLLNSPSDPPFQPGKEFNLCLRAAECATFSIKIGITAIINKSLEIVQEAKRKKKHSEARKHFYYKKLLTMDSASHVVGPLFFPKQQAKMKPESVWWKIHCITAKWRFMFV